MAAVAVAAMVVSCNKPGEGTEIEKTNAKKSVSIAIANMENGKGLSRATGSFTEEPAGGIGIAVASTDELWAVFADEDGNLVGTPVKLEDVDDEAENQNAATADEELYIYTFHELSVDVEKIAITDIDPTGDNPLAVVPDGGENPGFATLAEIVAYGQSVEGFAAQHGTTMELEDIFVYGATTTTFTTTGLVENHNGVDIIHYYGGEVEVLPMLARIEIGNILCNNLGLTLTEEEIEAGEKTPQFGTLTLKAIGINNVYDAISTTAAGRELINYTADAAGLAQWNGDCGYAVVDDPETEDVDETKPEAASTWNIDKFSAELGNNTTPYNAGAFVYNFVPGNVPNIILEIGEATWNKALGDIDLALDGPFFVKSTGLASGDVDITETVAGAIYQVNFEFACENVTGWSTDTTLKCVSIDVIIPKWEIKPSLKPKFGDE